MTCNKKHCTGNEHEHNDGRFDPIRDFFGSSRISVGVDERFQAEAGRFTPTFLNVHRHSHAVHCRCRVAGWRIFELFSRQRARSHIHDGSRQRNADFLSPDTA